MRHTRFRLPGPIWRIAVLALALAGALALDLLLATIPGPGLIRLAFAQEGAAPVWEQLPGPSGPVSRLFMPSSGALLAQLTDTLYRSDDGGNAWQSMPLPASAPNAQPTVAVDPTNHDTLYVAGPDGLLKSTDAGATWALVLARDAAFPRVVSAAVSPADPNIVYLALTDSGATTIRFLRSLDGGATWETAEEDGHQFLACQWGVSILQPHPTDPARLFRAVSCAHSGDFSANLQESRDQGASWNVLVDAGGPRPETVHDPRTNPAPGPAPAPIGRVQPTPPGGHLVAQPTQLTGGSQSNRRRFFLALNKDYRGGGSSLLRSDDDGRTWFLVFDATGGGSATGPNDTRTNVTIGGVSEDPIKPGRVYVAFREQVKGGPALVTVRVSEDGGNTWADLASIPTDQAYHLGLGIDGANLYAATDQGVWRLPLH